MNAPASLNALAGLATLLLGTSVTACGPELQGREASRRSDVPIR